MSEIKKMNETELLELLKESRDKVRSIRFGSAGAQTSDTEGLRGAKKDIARTLTELNYRAREVAHK